MAEIGLPQRTPDVGIKGNAQSLQTLDRKATLDSAPASSPHFATAMTELAASPTVLGEFASQLAVNSSNALAMKWGYESGLKPNGNMLPPITNFDKQFSDSYISQSQNTLGLQANKLLMEGQNEINQAWKITPELINSYTQNMQEGLTDIYEVAPDAIKGSLALQAETSLARSRNSLNNKMITQQHNEALQKASIENNNQLSSIYETARSGNGDAAKVLSDALIEKSQRMQSAGMISAVQVESIRKSAQTSYYTGKYTGEAINAYHNKTADAYLANFLTNKPKDLNSLEWESIAKNVMQEVHLQEQFQQRNETALYSEGHRLLSEGILTKEFIERLEQETTSKPRFNEFMAQVAVQKRKHYSQKESAQSGISQWTNTDYMSQLSKKSKNDSLVLATQDAQNLSSQFGRQIDYESAEVEAMSTVAVPIPAFTEKMNRGFLSGNPNIMLSKLQAYNILNNSNPRVLNGLNGKALAMKTQFELQMEDGHEPDVAAQRAYNVVQQKTPEQQEINTTLTKQWENKNVSTQPRLESWAVQFVDTDAGATINNLPAFAIHAKNIYKSNLNYHNGDEEAALKDTADGIKKAWGITNINGKKEFTFQPIESTIGLDAGAVPLIREDIYNQLQAQIAPMNEIYNDGVKKKDKRMSFYYRLPERPTFEKYLEATNYIKSQDGQRPLVNNLVSPLNRAQLAIQDKTKDDNRFIDAQKIINEYKNQDITIERINDSGVVEKFQVAVQADPGLQVTDEGTIGNYNVSIRIANGPSSPMNGWFRGPLSMPIIRPRAELIRSRYFQLIGLDATGLTPQQMYDRWIAKNSAIDQSARIGVSALGMGF